MNTFPEYIPIATTIFSTYFFIEIFKHYVSRKTPYLLWWAIGVLTFGLGTLTESINVLVGWSPLNTQIWYIVGALLGGYPLAQGSVYLLMSKKFADRSAFIFSSLIIIAGVCVMLSPVVIPEGFDYKLTGKVLEWKWVRYFSPFINLYAAGFLIGGAAYSAYKYYKSSQPDLIEEAIDENIMKKEGRDPRFLGNTFIAIGGLLPGIGGSMTRAGYVNVLFVTEFLGLVLIYIGYRVIKTYKRSKYSTAT